MARPGAAAVPEDLHHRVMAAAAECFRKWGLRKTTMGDIADAAAILRPRLYDHYENKEALIAAAIVHESEELSRRRLARYELKGPARDLLVEVLLSGQSDIENDAFLAEVMAGHGAGLLVRLLFDDEGFLEANGRWWNAVLDYGRQRGEIREELTNADIIRWFLLQQMNMAERAEIFDTPARMREHLKKFVVPAVTR